MIRRRIRSISSSEGAGEDRELPRREPGLSRGEEAQATREREDPLPDGDRGEHVADEVRGAVLHAARGARRADLRLAGERDEPPEAAAGAADVHDFPSDAVGKAIPYAVYDVAANDGFVIVGVDHDTPVFAVTSIEAWWNHVGVKRYPEAREIFITADAGSSNSYRSHVWKQQLQRVADKLDIAIHVWHFPPGTSNWNKVEHRLFSFISINWRGRPLRSYETIINLIGNTTNHGGLVVRARLDRRNYSTGKRVSAKELRELFIERDEVQGDWNYVITPRKGMND